MLKRSIPITLICSLLATACSGPDVLSNEHRQRIRSVAVNLSEPAKETIYIDKSSTVLVVALGFGVLGGLAGAANMAAGESRFSPVTEPHRATVSAILTAKLNDAFARAGKKVGNPDAKLTVKNLRYGVGHSGTQKFVAVVSGEFKLSLPDGETAFEQTISATSDRKFSRLEAQANREIYRSAFEEAAEKLSNQLSNNLWSARPEETD